MKFKVEIVAPLHGILLAHVSAEGYVGLSMLLGIITGFLGCWFFFTKSGWDFYSSKISEP